MHTVHGPDCFIYDLYLKATKIRTQIEWDNRNKQTSKTVNPDE